MLTMATQTETIELEYLQESRYGTSPLTRLPTSGSATIPTGAHGQTFISQSTEPPMRRLTKKRTWMIIVQLAGINFVTSFSNGLLVIALPAIAQDLNLPASLLLWPSSVYALTCGSCLLLAGTIADVVGARSVNLTGCFFNALFTLLNGFSQTGIQLVMFRAMQGIASALAFPSAMSIVSRSVESGKPRNIGFASLGLAMPLGFLAGLVLGGVFVNTAGWRAGYWFGAGFSLVLSAIGVVILPTGLKDSTENSIWRRLTTKVDW